MKVTLMICFNQSMLLLYRIYNFFYKNSGLIIDSVIDQNVSISKYNHLAGSSYIKLPKELDYSRKRLNI